MPSKAAIREVYSSSADAIRTAERGAAILWAAARKVLGVCAAMLNKLSHNGHRKARGLAKSSSSAMTSP